MNKIKYYDSIFAILRIDTNLKENNARIVGTGFVINNNPIQILTCNHVVGEGTENNDGKIVYSIVKRSDAINEFDLRNFQISFLKAKRIIFKPESDVALLEIDPSLDMITANKLGIPENIKSLDVDFDENSSDIGSSVEWVGAGTLGDLTVTPRFFKGNIVTKYIKDQKYTYKDREASEKLQEMKGVSLFEINQLFLPGCSGSPIISSNSEKVIGWVHGFNSWAIPTANPIQYDANLSYGDESQNVKIKANATLGASLSIGIDIKNIKDFLKENIVIKN